MTPAPLDKHALVLHPRDSVAVLKTSLPQGFLLQSEHGPIRLRQEIPAGHKVALHPIGDDQPVLKYGQIIGFAHGPIHPGDHVHVHNLKVRDFHRAFRVGEGTRPVDLLPEPERRQFLGFSRAAGRAGTRNYVAIISVVNCSATVARSVQQRFQPEQLARDFPNVDGVLAFTHKTGCGIQPGVPQDTVERVFAGLARHPNISACLCLGLGCEVSHLRHLRETFHFHPGPAETGGPLFMEIQSLGGTRKTVQAASEAVLRLLRCANGMKRTPQPLRHLALALNCGGSDAHSGITANPALGVAVDLLVRHGGTAVLAETPEIYGAEHLLLHRAASPEIAQQLQEIIHWWEAHVRLHGASIDNNPSPGNKDGGLTTIYEKSLGAVAKAGQSPLMAVYRYAEPVQHSGLCFMDTPGFDPVSMTGLVAGGCNLGVFTTGRGSVYGCKPAPCLKVATNTPLFNWMRDDMDLNAGTILDGAETVEQVGQRIFERVIAVASGEKTQSELLGMGDEEFAPWVLGPTF